LHWLLGQYRGCVLLSTDRDVPSGSGSKLFSCKAGKEIVMAIGTSRPFTGDTITPERRTEYREELEGLLRGPVAPVPRRSISDVNIVKRGQLFSAPGIARRRTALSRGIEASRASAQGNPVLEEYGRTRALREFGAGLGEEVGAGQRLGLTAETTDLQAQIAADRLQAMLESQRRSGLTSYLTSEARESGEFGPSGGAPSYTTRGTSRVDPFYTQEAIRERDFGLPQDPGFEARFKARKVGTPISEPTVWSRNQVAIEESLMGVT
jgi:hypothetical protein